MLRLGRLKLAHKGVLLVAVPLIVQGALYLQLKHDFARAEARARQADLTRQIVSRVNTLFLNTFHGFQALVQMSMYGNKTKDTRHFSQYVQSIEVQIKALADELEFDAGEPEDAATIRRSGAIFLSTFHETRLKVDRKNEAVSIIANLESNMRFKEAALTFLRQLQATGLKEQAKLVPQNKEEQIFRSHMQNIIDAAALFNLSLALLLALFFVRGTVSHLNILKSNAVRFASDEPLLPAIDAADEIGEVDKRFHEMADALVLARSREKEMHEEVKRGKERLDLMIENVPLALVVYDDQGIVRSFNSSAEKLFEYKRENVIAKPVETLFQRPSQQKGSETLFSFLCSADSSESHSMEAVGQSGEVIPVEVTTSSFDSDEGKRYLSTIKDISERFRIEQMKRNFYQMVSHDIRAPLASISGVLQLVRDGRYGSVSERAQKYLMQAEGNVGKLLDLVGRLLQLEKVESGTLSVSRQDVAIAGIFADTRSALEQFARSNKVKLKFDKSDAVVNADPVYLTSALSNLVSNAVKFSPPGKEVRVEITELEDEVEVSVIDQGPGIAKRQQQKIFERYSQIRQEQSMAPGFGLGLAISKSIVELHGGEIGVESEPGKGSRFWFRIARGRGGRGSA